MNPLLWISIGIAGIWWWASTHGATVLNYSISNINFSFSSFTITLTIQNPTGYDAVITTLTGTAAINGTMLGTGSVGNVAVPASSTITQDIQISMGDLSVLTSAISIIQQSGAQVTFTGKAFIGTTQEAFNVSYSV